MGNRFRIGFHLAVAFLTLLAFVVVFGPALAPYDPLAQNLRNPFGPPTWVNWLGTDNLGRDVLTRLMIGARPALTGVLIAVGTAALVGVPWGLTAGYIGGLLDNILMRIADALLVFPGLILALVLTAVFGPSLKTSMIAIGFVYSPILARVVRSGVLVVRNRDYVVVTRLYGLSGWHRMWQHVLPNAAAPIIVQITLLMGLSLLAQIGLGFLGVGLQPPNPSWGGALAESFPYIIVSPQASIVPGVVVVLTVLSLYRVGDELRDRFTRE